MQELGWANNSQARHFLWEPMLIVFWAAVQVAEEIWVCEKGTVKPWTKDIRAYKAKLAKTMKATT